MLDGIQRVVKGSVLQVYQAPISHSPPFVPEFVAPLLIPIDSVHSRRKSLFLQFHPTFGRDPSRCGMTFSFRKFSFPSQVCI